MDQSNRVLYKPQCRILLQKDLLLRYLMCICIVFYGSRTVPSVFIFLMIIGVEFELSLDELVIYLIEAGKCLLL